MSMCERCWVDARSDPDKYHALVASRECTPEEQAGELATVCPQCKRHVLHQYTQECMAGCEEPDDGLPDK